MLKGNAATCKHSRKSVPSKMGGKPLSVYATCPKGVRNYKGYILLDRTVCDTCDRYKKS